MDAETKYNVASFLVVVSIITCTLSLIAIFIAYPIKSCCRPDANSVTVTILSILVTLLIGWNIYALVDVKEIKKEYDRIQNRFSCDISTATENAIKKMNDVSDANVIMLISCNCYDRNDYTMAVNGFLEAIKIGTKCDNASAVINSLNRLIKMATHNVDIRIYESDKQKMFGILKAIDINYLCGLKNNQFSYSESDIINVIEYLGNQEVIPDEEKIVYG